MRLDQRTGQYTVGAGADTRPGSKCRVCAAVQQYAMNWALLLDFALNTILAGSPNETVSQRTARARRAGSRHASAFCSVLTWVWKHIFRSSEPDHCDWSMAEGSIGQEIWNWTSDVPNPPAPPDRR